MESSNRRSSSSIRGEITVRSSKCIFIQIQQIEGFNVVQNQTGKAKVKLRERRMGQINCSFVIGKNCGR